MQGLEPPLAPNRENSDAERTILGAILLDNKALDTALEKLKPDDFFHDFHRKIFQQMIVARSAGTPIDLVTLTDELYRAGQLEDAGDAKYLQDLTDGVPRVRNVEYYARIVKGNSLLRRIIKDMGAIQRQALEAGADADTILERADQSIAALRGSSATDWKKKFHTIDELPDGDVEFLIDAILPAGVSFVGGLSGGGKTWFALAMGRALQSGKKFLGVWSVPEVVKVLYLCPEMQARAFKKRCRRFGIAGAGFRCMTISDGAALDLADPLLRAAIRDMRGVVFLDTAIRFSNAEDENSATENSQGLARAIFALLHAGARAVVSLHHRSKDSARAEDLSLENCLRWSGDLGAMCDAVYGLLYDRGDGSAQYLRESKRLLRLSVRCVKSRDFRPPADFRVQLEPFIDEIGDMAVLAGDPESAGESEVERLSKAIAENPKATKVELQAMTGVGRNRMEKLAAQDGWFYEPKAGWQHH